MRILFVVGSLTGGGAEQVVARLASSMSQNGNNIQVDLISSPKVTYNISKSVNINFIPSKSKIPGIRYLERLLAFRKNVRRFKPDVVVSFTTGVSIFVLIALLFSKAKVVVSERNNPYVDPKSKRDRILRSIFYNLADGFVFQTPFARDYFSNKIARHSTIIINPLDESLPTPYDGVREKTIVSVGRLEPQKNHLLLIDAFNRIADDIKDYKLLIYGEGTLRPLLQEKINLLKLADRIELKGYADNVTEKIKKSSLFVLSSDYEGISNSLLEALAIGLPTISTDHPIGGAQMLINNGINGLLVPIGDEEKLSESMKRVLKDKVLSNDLSRESRKIMERVKVEEISQKWIRFLSKVINKK